MLTDDPIYEPLTSRSDAPDVDVDANTPKTDFFRDQREFQEVEGLEVRFAQSRGFKNNETNDLEERNRI
jgi:hypothetical protein